MNAETNGMFTIWSHRRPHKSGICWHQTMYVCSGFSNSFIWRAYYSLCGFLERKWQREAMPVWVRLIGIALWWVPRSCVCVCVRCDLRPIGLCQAHDYIILLRLLSQLIYYCSARKCSTTKTLWDCIKTVYFVMLFSFLFIFGWSFIVGPTWTVFGFLCRKKQNDGRGMVDCCYHYIRLTTTGRGPQWTLFRCDKWVWFTFGATHY